MRTRLGIPLVLVCGSNLPFLCGAWSNAIGMRLLGGIGSGWKRKRRVVDISSSTIDSTTSLMMSSSSPPGSEDSAMSAYDRAMASYNQQAATPAGPLGVGEGQVQNHHQQQQPQEEDNNNDRFQEFFSDNSGIDYRHSTTTSHHQEAGPDATADGFVKSNFNDPWYSSQERGDLEKANTWTGPMTGGEGGGISTGSGDAYLQQQQQQQQQQPMPQFAVPLSHGDNTSSGGEEGVGQQQPTMPSTQALSSGTDLSSPPYHNNNSNDNINNAVESPSSSSSSPLQYQQSFLDALSPNSDKRKRQDGGGLTMPNDDSSSSSPTTTSGRSNSMGADDQPWKPILEFVEKGDHHTSQSQQQQPSTPTTPPQQQHMYQSTGQNLSQRPGQPEPSRMYVNQPPSEGTATVSDGVATTPPGQTTIDQQQAGASSSSSSSAATETPLVQQEDQTAQEVSLPPQQQEQEQQEQQTSSSSSSSTELNDFMNTAWEDQQKTRTNPFLKSIASDLLGGMTKTPPSSSERRKQKKGPSSSFEVQPGVTKRILQAMDKDRAARNPQRPFLSQWEAFQNAEKRWNDLKLSRKFRYDFKLFRSIQDGAGPPLQFVSDDCARGNAKCCAKLRDACLRADGVGGVSEECMDLDYEGPPLDDFGQPLMDYDVVVLGGTLGIFYGMALQMKGLKVCVVAPRELRGQEQEWNVARKDLLELQRLGILDTEDIEACVTTVFDGTRAGFKNREVTPLSGGLKDNEGTGFECYLNGVLNLGVSPRIIIERVAARFKEIGGVVRERCPLGGVAVSPQVGCAIDLGSYNPDEDVEPITAKLVLDCMGYGSPVARQQRYGQRPDSMCMVFGSSAGGYNQDRNRFADAIYSFNGLQDFGSSGKHQYFWETFPVGTNLTAPQTSDKSWFDKVAFGNLKDAPLQGPQVTSDVKTTYMFTYMDANKRRPTLESLMDDYFKLLPEYQKSINNPETDLKINRVLYDYFPAYRDSPMKPQHSRVLSVGEAAGLQSPISFGGFRSLSRHLGRVSGAVAEAVETGCLHKDDLGEINAYLPNLSAAWLFRDVMSIRMKRKGGTKEVDPEFTNRVLAVYMKAMYDAGPTTVSPLMHDVLRFDAVAATLVSGIFSDPVLMGELVKHVGPTKMMDFLGNVANMGLYSLLDVAVAPIVKLILDRIDDPRMKFQMRRKMEAWKYGSGNDYKNK